MVNLYFHIGLSRTATTLFQHMIMQPRVRERMLDFGIVYTDVLQLTWKYILGFDDSSFLESRDRARAGLPVYEALRAGEISFGPEAKDRFRKLIEERLSDHPGKVVCSQEGFSDLYLFMKKLGREAELADFLSVLREYFEPVIVAVVRRQDTFIESFYAYSVRVGYASSFADFLEDFPVETLHWNDVIDFFHGVAPAATPRVVPMESSLLQPLGLKNAPAAVFRMCDMNMEFGEMPLVNASMAEDVIPVVVEANRTLPPARALELANALTTSFPKEKGERFRLFSDNERQDFLARFKDSNADLFSRFSTLPADSYAPARET